MAAGEAAAPPRDGGQTRIRFQRLESASPELRLRNLQESVLLQPALYGTLASLACRYHVTVSSEQRRYTRVRILDALYGEAPAGCYV